MERIVYRISLDATKSGIQGTLQGFMTGDILSRRIEITLAYRGESVALTESETAVMYIHKTGAETPSINSCTIDGDKVIYDVLQSDVDTAGITKMQLKIVSGEQVLMSPYFAIEVTDSMTGDTQAVTTPTYTALETALAQAQTVYDSRLISVELGEDLIFTATYADGTIYTSDAIANEIGGVSEAEAARIIAEENRVLAESERANEFATMKNDVQRAVDTTTELQNEVKSLVDSNVVTTEDRQKWDGKADGLSYVGSKLSLLNGNEVLNTVEIIGGGGGEVVIPDKVLTATNVTATEAVTPVLNAELFGSRAPEAYALKEELTAHNVPRLSFDSLTEIETFVNNYSASFDDGIFYEFEVNGVAEYELSEGVWYISGTKTDSLYETQAAKRYCPDGVELKRRSKYNGAWSRWVADVNALDLANYLPKTGGTVDGHLFVASSEAVDRMIYLQNSVRSIFQKMHSNGLYQLYDKTNNKAIIESTANGTNTFNGTASGNLPMNGGGTVKKEGDTPLVVENTKAGNSYTYIGYKNSNGINYMGFNNGKPYVYGQGNILHTGNKPTGTYTGNGSATTRTISTNGLGNCVLIFRGASCFAILSQAGYIAFNGTSVVCGTDAYFSTGKIYISSTSELFNTSGISYEYQVL